MAAAWRQQTALGLEQGAAAQARRAPKRQGLGCRTRHGTGRAGGDIHGTGRAGGDIHGRAGRVATQGGIALEDMQGRNGTPALEDMPRA